MRAEETRWKEILRGASEEVLRVTSRIYSSRSRSRVAGRGASGDKTLVADRDAERVLTEALSGVPDLRILSEEAGEMGDPASTYLAVLDPLDGSSNFERGIPFFCTSIAIVEGNGLSGVRFALVRDLVTGDAYYAERGRGATKNGRQIRTSQRGDLTAAVIGVDISRATAKLISDIAPLLSEAKRQVHLGANALELCLLAEGKLDAFIDIRGLTRSVDFAGAYLIATEAGALVTSRDGGRLDPRLDLEGRFSFVASGNRRLHRMIIDRLKGG